MLLIFKFYYVFVRIENNYIISEYNALNKTRFGEQYTKMSVSTKIGELFQDLNLKLTKCLSFQLRYFVTLKLGIFRK